MPPPNELRVGDIVNWDLHPDLPGDCDTQEQARSLYGEGPFEITRIFTGSTEEELVELRRLNGEAVFNPAGTHVFGFYSQRFQLDLFLNVVKERRREQE